MSNYTGILKKGNDIVILNDAGEWKLVYTQDDEHKVYIKRIGNICHMKGNLNGNGIEGIYVPLGFTATYLYTHTFCGNGSSLVKGYINVGTNVMGFSTPTLVNSNYIITCSFIID